MLKLLLIALLVYGVYHYLTTKKRTMTAADARALLGVPPGADLEQVREAHRRLIAKVHPDSGGSAELASRVNLARDTLVGELRSP